MDGGVWSSSNRDQSDLRGASGRLIIDLAAIRRNYLQLSEQLAPVKAGAVVKADAYGLGADRVVPVLYSAGCRNFFVAHFGEALKIRPRLAGDARIFVLNGLQPGSENACADANVIPVANSPEQLERWASVARNRGKKLPVILQFDTGMSRLGMSADDSALLAREPNRLSDVDVLFIMSHLASADEADSEQNGEQLAAMQTVAAQFPGTAICFANSGGIFLGSDYHAGLARPGIALYGGAPISGAANPMRAAVRLDVSVIQTRTVPAGTRIGYGGVHVAETEMRLATIAAGYADGLPRSLSDRGAAFYGATRLPIVGRVSMDSMTINVTALPPGTLTLGSFVEIIGEHQTLEDVADAAGTISYEILTSLGQRYQREYRGLTQPQSIQQRA
ncbi:alanine racemase [Rhizobium sp. S96]|uniref:alanine racemase n=1 Tax=Rhizobium sp. S96 TaxID=3055140 RepID=UPI0025AA92AD|nr:alanine racemase [Rhizobium sp. S96]MDM9623057.1 alanine racemase [Rhizobium sp. S96]